MKRYLENFLPIIIILALFVGCKEDDEETIFKYAGDPYTGPLNVMVTLPDNTVQAYYGTGSAHFVDENGMSKLAVYGTIGDEEGEASFSIIGSKNGDTWKGTSNDMTFDINADGIISGGGTIHPQKLKFSGTASESAFNLLLQLELLEATQGLPEGTIVNYEYDLSRQVEGGNSSGKECKNIRWEFRNIWTPGGLQLIQVPVCHD